MQIEELKNWFDNRPTKENDIKDVVKWSWAKVSAGKEELKLVARRRWVKLTGKYPLSPWVPVEAEEYWVFSSCVMISAGQVPSPSPS